MNSNDDADDQILITKYCNKNLNDIYIDLNNKINININSAYPLNKITDIIEIDNKIFSYNNRLFFVHGPGSTFLDELIINLFDENPNLNDEFKIKFYKTVFNNIKIYILFY